MKFHIQTFGCQMNVYDTNTMTALLSSAGHISTENLSEAELILLNTCSIREGAEERVRGRLGQLKKLKDRGVLKYLGICGCMGQREGKQFTDRVGFLDLVMGPGAVGSIVPIVNQLQKGVRPIVDIHGIDDDFDEVNPSPDDEITYPCFVSIMKGCDKRCTYCIVPFVRGPERSRDPRIVLQECEELAQKGAKEITLIGQTVNSYQYQDISFKKLLALVNEIDGVERIRFSTSYPRDADYAMFDAVAELDKVCEHIHLPVQSGSNRVLRRMARGYTREMYEEKIAYFRSLFQGRTVIPAVTTDMIVGFPGESEDDFEQTLEMVQAVGFDSAFMFKYSPRPGTVAAQFSDQVDEFTKARRLDRLIALQHEIGLALNRDWIGSKAEVMVERPGTPVGDEIEYEARLRTGRVVKVTAASGRYKPGDIFQVEITDCSTYALFGKPVQQEECVHAS
ncbi:MAG: tRNA (N6-isopentenyl adenosine(37)-C2)-methylthiotransferase MiaB [bacterium]|jgi:tRNA-2-methylthio-N6-dimethylallyladenosine synthase|nr:tRNA (N6-isopentenyl adenosine(37)-C2)-methylthiotransferase MiaB [bacterium]